ncbi:styryl dye vacuolar localization protein 3 [[Candida] railenensis]|uniref:Styryl dye vacuolar localization protein 3 n=1 Tax=[Candida] railenensis TaxID=45579 RepID=A0A9P0VYS0_9ASCO|nr:styryl dye vacuolar localization protein 3 [[Candida] railenensis]
MSDFQVLTIGENPNVVFYAWRLLETNSCSVSIVNQKLSPTDPITFQSSSFSSTSGKSHSFHPSGLHHSIQQVPSGIKYDLVVLSAFSLQAFQSICQDLAPYLKENTTILVESTGFVNLEPFITLSLPKLKNLAVASIMNEFDIRLVDGNQFSHKTRANESRLYVGNPTSSKKNGGSTFQKTLKLFQLVQDSSKGKINLLIANSSKEFMTYQWKLALPRIIFSPLSVIFETYFPEELSKQILCKPLVTGLITEIFKIIKKMDCKLVKGSENEANLWKNWIDQFPIINGQGEDTLMDSPPLFYNYYQQYDLEIDLLLLQPILLADDHGIRTPYLENLYSIMCQYIKVNDPNVDSIFFQRRGTKNPSNNDYRALDEEYNEKTRHIELMNQDYDAKSSKLSRLNQQVNDLQLHFKSLEISHTNKEVEENQIKINIERSRLELDKLISSLNEKKLQIESLDKDILRKKEEVSNFKTPENAQGPFPGSTSKKEGAKPENAYRQSLIASPQGMKEMSDVALYGAALNGEIIQEANEPNGTEAFSGYQENGNSTGIPEKLSIDTQNVQKPRAYDQNQGMQGFQGQPPVAQGQGQAPQGQQQVQPGFQGQVNPQGQQPGSGYQNGFQQNNQYAAGSQQQYPPPQAFAQQPFSQQQPQPQQQQQQQQQQPYNYNNNYQNQQFGYKQNNYGNPQQNNGYYQSPMDQHPPHGLPTNGGIPPIFNNNLQMNNRYQPQQQMNNGFHPQKQRLSSIPSSIHSYYDQQGNGSNGYGPNGPGPQNGPNGGYANGYNGNGPNAYGGNNNGYQNQQKKGGRRSMFPQPSGNALQGLDMGGRGGMPMPTGPTGERPGSSGAVKNRPVTMNSPPMNQRKSQADLQIPPAQHGSSTYLQIPNTNRSNTSSLSTNDTPKTSQSRDDVSEGLQVQVPISNEPAGKPLGAVKNMSTLDDNKKKKTKSGIFGKKK